MSTLVPIADRPVPSKPGWSEIGARGSCVELWLQRHPAREQHDLTLTIRYFGVRHRASVTLRPIEARELAALLLRWAGIVESIEAQRMTETESRKAFPEIEAGLKGTVPYD